jgi:futalosine hydrolase
VDRTGIDDLRELARGRSVVLLTATEAEAEPLRAALVGARPIDVGTKAVWLGELEVAAPAPAESALTPCGQRVPCAVPVVLAVGGCDKANTAHILTCLFEAMRPGPSLVVQVGIAGAFRAPKAATDGKAAGAILQIGDLVLATQEAYSDTGSSSPEGWLSAADLGLPIARVAGVELGGVFPLDPSLVEAALAAVASLDWPGALTVVHAGPCVTSSQATGRQAEADAIHGRWGALAESMEGAAAAHICALYGVPFLEIRGISNLVGDRDRAAWQVEPALAAAGKAALAVVAGLSR